MNEAILKLIKHILDLKQDIEYADLCDGTILYNLMHHYDEQNFHELEYQSPTKNFQLNFRTMKILIDNLNKVFQITDIDILKIVKDKNEIELTKLITAIMRYLVTNHQFLNDCNNLDSDIEFLNEYLDVPEQNNQFSLLHKIDELEEENQNLKDAMNKIMENVNKLNKKIKEQEQTIRDRDTEIQEFKFNTSQHQNIDHTDSIDKLKKQIITLNTEIKQLQSQNRELHFKLESNGKLQQDVDQLQKELIKRDIKDKKYEELKYNFKLLKDELHSKTDLITKLQQQNKQIYQLRQDDSDKIIQLEMQYEQCKQELEDISRIKGKEIYQLQQKLIELQQALEKYQMMESSQETARSSVQRMSPRCLELELSQADFFFTEQEYKKQIAQQDKLYQQKIQTLQSQIESEKQKKQQALFDKAHFQQVENQLKSEIIKIKDESYAWKEAESQKQQNFLLISIIDALKDKIHILQQQYSNSLQKEQKPPRPIKTSAFQV